MSKFFSNFFLNILMNFSKDVIVGYSDWVVCELYLIQNHFVYGRDYVYSVGTLTFYNEVRYGQYMCWFSRWR